MAVHSANVYGVYLCARHSAAVLPARIFLATLGQGKIFMLPKVLMPLPPPPLPKVLSWLGLGRFLKVILLWWKVWSMGWSG